MHDFFILDYHHTTPDIWIIQDENGNVRVWDSDYYDSCNETFFGSPEDIVFEKVEGKEEYIKVAV